MLPLAIKAKIPILRVTTTDIINLPDVLAAITGKSKDELVETKGATIPSKGDVVYALNPVPVVRAHYEEFAENGRVLVLVNQGEDCPFAFDAGEVPVPKELVENLVLRVAPKKALKELMPAFNGLTLKGVAEVIMLTTARDKSLTARGVAQSRAMLTGKTPGLGQVNTELSLYICPEPLAAWTMKNKRFFLEAPDHRLVPRGLLLAGAPGVGKSQAAKWIANEWGVPLYRLDMASALSKWISESEANLARVLNTLDQEEPAVLLIDETEKIFAETEDQGTTARLLSQLLWWMQEHKTRVLTVMTTNDRGALPHELYRAGRIDTVMVMEKLDYDEAFMLCLASLKQFLEVTKVHTVEIEKALKKRMKKDADDADKSIAHAEVVQLSVDLLKEKEWLQF